MGTGRAAIEVAAAVGVAGGGWAAGWAATGAADGSPVRWAAAGALAATTLGLQFALGRRTRDGGAPAAQAAPAAASAAPVVDSREARAFLDLGTSHGDATQHPALLARGVAELLAGAGAEQVRLFALDPNSDVLHDVAGGAPVALDRRVATWLAVNPAPIRTTAMGELRLGGLRDPVTQFVRSTDAELLIPLIHRERLVGLVTAARARKVGSVAHIQEAAAGALGQLLLQAAVAQQADVALEVAVAAQVQRDTEPRTTIEDVAGCRVARYYAPARQFSGAWWIARELPDGRLFTALGEVTGRGVPAALLSASALGVCEATIAMLGGGVELHAVLELVHLSVGRAGGGAYGMSCLVALVDAAGGTITFSSAGHPFPYQLRRTGTPGEPDAMRALVSRGSLLGGADRPVRSVSTEEIQPGDVLVFFSASTTDARTEDGQTFGDRRLQNTLRRASVIGASAPDGTPLATHVGLAIEEHVAGRTPDDDILVATIEIG